MKNVELGITLSGRYVAGLAIRSVSLQRMLHRDWLRIRSTTHSTSLMRFTSKNNRIFKYTLALFLEIFFTLHSFGQSSIQGQVIDANSGEPLPFAVLVNRTSKIGTLSNEEGKFSIGVASYQDTIECSYVGYTTTIVVPSKGAQNIIIALSESDFALEEIVVRPAEDWYLHNLLEECRRKGQKGASPQKAKTYLETKSFRDGQLIEYFERYVEGTFESYDVTRLQHKAGRLAVKPFNNRYFFSRGISSGIMKMKTLGRNQFFPVNPLEMGMKKRKKAFFLQLEQTYQNKELDSIYVVSYWPKGDKRAAFKGKIWINITHNIVERITMNCEGASISPFIAQFPGHQEIMKITFEVNKFFNQVGGFPQFSHTYFNYVVDYNADRFSDTLKPFQVLTQSVLFPYDFGDSFFMPLYENTESKDDYRTLSSMPHNDFFWRNHTEFRFGEGDFMLEFTKDSTVTYLNNHSYGGLADASIFNKWPLGFEHPYVLWSNKSRFLIRDIANDNLKQLKSYEPTRPLADYYHLDVQLFIDFNHFMDSTHCLSSVIINPFNSYYRLPMDNFTDAVFNLAFDLCEIERRKLEQEIISLTYSDVNEAYRMLSDLYHLYQTRINSIKAKYFKDVQRGNNLDALIKYNELVCSQLGIDNLSLFGLSDVLENHR